LLGPVVTTGGTSATWPLPRPRLSLRRDRSVPSREADQPGGPQGRDQQEEETGPRRNTLQQQARFPSRRQVIVAT
jgi:hypothetical protein